jgi:flavin-binding protein dodecin
VLIGRPTSFSSFQSRILQKIFRFFSRTPPSKMPGLTERLRALYESESKGKTMAKQVGSAESIYKLVEVIGTSTKSWDDAAKNAVETAAGTLRDLRIAEVVKLDMKVEDGKVRAYRARVMLSFKYES